MKRPSILTRARDRGVSLIFALIALAAISLAAVALVRSVHGGSFVIGNLGFKQDTTRAADVATEQARKWLTTSGHAMTENGADGTGYYATARTNIDPTGQRTSSSNKMDVIAWEGTTCSCAGSTCGQCLKPSNAVSISGGNVRAQYLITRLCPIGGAIGISNACAQPVSVDENTCKSKGGLTANEIKICEEQQQAPYYRIIVRTVGGRNTVSYTETIVH